MPKSNKVTRIFQTPRLFATLKKHFKSSGEENWPSVQLLMHVKLAMYDEHLLKSTERYLTIHGPLSGAAIFSQ